MAYRRRQGMSRSSTFKEAEKNPPPDEGEWAATSSLAAQAIAASAAHRHSKGGPTYDYTSMGSSNETGSFWGVLARKAKAILEDDNINNNHPTTAADHHHHHQYSSSSAGSRPTASPHNYQKKVDMSCSPSLITCSMRDSLGKTLEEGLTTPAQKPPPETTHQRKIQIVRKGGGGGGGVMINDGHGHDYEQHKPKNPTTQEDQLKASRDVSTAMCFLLFLGLVNAWSNIHSRRRLPMQVAMATAAKAKLLLRELKTVKADLAFAKQRCSQLEEENKILRDAHRDKSINPWPADDDMIRNQLETLLAEKARLAHENSVYARDNRVLREIVEYHQLTMQDVIYLDENEGDLDEEEEEAAVAEAYPMFTASMPHSPTDPTSPPPQISLFRSASATTAEMRFLDSPTKSPTSSSSKTTTTSSSIPRRPARRNH